MDECAAPGYRAVMQVTPQVATSSLAALLTAQGAFQAGLAAGLPWGRAAYGGQHAGRLPATHRRTSGVASVVYVGLAGLIGSGAGTPRARHAVLTGLSALLVGSTGLNLASRSAPERLIWTPFCALTAALAWRARESDRRGEGGIAGR